MTPPVCAIHVLHKGSHVCKRGSSQLNHLNNNCWWKFYGFVGHSRAYPSLGRCNFMLTSNTVIYTSTLYYNGLPTLVVTNSAVWLLERGVSGTCLLGEISSPNSTPPPPQLKRFNQWQSVPTYICSNKCFSINFFADVYIVMIVAFHPSTSPPLRIPFLDRTLLYVHVHICENAHTRGIIL